MSGTRDLICEMLRLFYAKNWVSGTGGGICATESPGRLVVAPTGVHKERVRPDDLFVVDPATGTVLESPVDATLEPSECTGVFCAIVGLRSVGSVVHSHALSSVLAGDMAADRLTISGFEMLKGIRGASNTDEHLVGVIENTARESDLVEQVEDVLARPWSAGAYALIVRDHGAYIWGDDLWEAKRHAEVYHWLFEGVLARRQIHAENANE